MNHTTTSRRRGNSKLPIMALLAIGGYFLWTENRALVIELLPWVLILGCVGMHFFMHRGHGSHGDSAARRGENQHDEAP